MTLTPHDAPFESKTTAYSLNNAYWLARAASVAYEARDTIQPAAAQLGMTRFKFLRRDDTEGFVAANDDVIVVSFRGTEPSHLQDLMADARIRQESGPMGKMHRGFLTAYRLVESDMVEAIQRMRNPSAPQSVWCTGHSLGAALAVVAVASLLEAGQPVSGLYNYGQPRVGSNEFAAEFERRFAGRHFRFVNNNDGVTRVPPRQLGYSHTGTLRYIDSDGDIQDDPGAWQQFLDRVSGRWEDFLKPGTDGLKDHFMDRYVEHIEKKVAP